MNKQNQNSVSTRLIRVNHVSKRLGIPERTVRYQTATGKLPGRKIGEKLWFYEVSEIEALQGSLGNRQ